MAAAEEPGSGLHGVKPGLGTWKACKKLTGEEKKMEEGLKGTRKVGKLVVFMKEEKKLG